MRDADEIDDASDALMLAALVHQPGDYLRRARELKGWTRVEMGKRLGLPVQEGRRDCQTLAEWENGRSPRDASREKIDELAKEVG